MIKKIIKIYQPYMVRPMIYQCATRISVAVVLALLWDRFINTEGYFFIVRDAFLVLGMFFFLLAWIQYLRMDGVKVSRASIQEKQKKRHVTRDIVDYADQKIISFSELDDEERVVCRLVGNALCGMIFLIPALISLLF